jgi:hypothetical protein
VSMNFEPKSATIRTHSCPAAWCCLGGRKFEPRACDPRCVGLDASNAGKATGETLKGNRVGVGGGVGVFSAHVCIFSCVHVCGLSMGLRAMWICDGHLHAHAGSSWTLIHTHLVLHLDPDTHTHPGILIHTQT